MQIIIRIHYYIVLFYTPLSDDFVCHNVQFLKKIAFWVMRHNVKPYRKAKVKPQSESKTDRGLLENRAKQKTESYRNQTVNYR